MILELLFIRLYWSNVSYDRKYNKTNPGYVIEQITSLKYFFLYPVAEISQQGIGAWDILCTGTENWILRDPVKIVDK